MVTVSHIVKKLIDRKPIFYDAICNKIVSFANLASNLKPDIEAELGKEINEQAIVMALRRYSETIKKKEDIKGFKYNSEIIMKTGLVDITFVKSPSLLKSLRKIYELIDFEKGDTLNVIHGNYEITMVVSEKYSKKILEILNEEKMLNLQENLVSLAMSFSKDFLYTPGILSKVTRQLFWDNINVFENISTMTELIFIIDKKDTMRAFQALERLIDGKEKNRRR
ncbi:MAG: hypothetical protein ABIH82_05330 [Candidatus Woesearchaeota archaeon]